jgi:hypothetical protein
LKIYVYEQIPVVPDVSKPGLSRGVGISEINLIEHL